MSLKRYAKPHQKLWPHLHKISTPSRPICALLHTQSALPLHFNFHIHSRLVGIYSCSSFPSNDLPFSVPSMPSTPLYHFLSQQSFAGLFVRSKLAPLWIYRYFFLYIVLFYCSTFYRNFYNNDHSWFMGPCGPLGLPAGGNYV
jgi:hypothetical protein